MGKVVLLLPALLFACQAVSSVNLQRNDLFELAGLAYVMSRDTVPPEDGFRTGEDAFFYMVGYGAVASELRAEVESRLAPFAGHRLIDFMRDFRRSATAFNLNDIYAMTNSLTWDKDSIVLKPGADIEMLDEICLVEGAGKTTAMLFGNLLKDFYDKTDFAGFLADNADYYERRADEVNEIYKNFDESYFESLMPGGRLEFVPVYSFCFGSTVVGDWRDGDVMVVMSVGDDRTCGTMGDDASWFSGSFNDLQMSGCDNYYNHSTYPWTHWGQNMGNPLVYGPLYGDDGRLEFHSNRIKAHHVGISGNPAGELAYRVLLSFTRHWGTYREPLDETRHQNSMLFELKYTPERLKGWQFEASCGIDDGDYLGSSVGGMLTIRKSGILWAK